MCRVRHREREWTNIFSDSIHQKKINFDFFFFVLKLPKFCFRFNRCCCWQIFFFTEWNYIQVFLANIFFWQTGIPVIINYLSGNFHWEISLGKLRVFFGSIINRIEERNSTFFSRNNNKMKNFFFFFFLISQWIHHHLDHFVVVVSNWTLLFCSLDDAIWNPRSRKKSAYMKKKEKKYRLLSDTMDSYSLGCCCFSALPEFILQNILPGFLMLLLLRKLFLIYKSLRSEERI